MTKQNFLKRCETIFDMGLVSEQDESIITLSFLYRATEVFMRLRHVYSKHPKFFENIKKVHQGEIAIDELTGHNLIDISKTLANDIYSHNALEIGAILAHPCQQCAEDKNAWHTRWAFCNHVNT